METKVLKCQLHIKKTELCNRFLWIKHINWIRVCNRFIWIKHITKTRVRNSFTWIKTTACNVCLSSLLRELINNFICFLFNLDDWMLHSLSDLLPVQQGPVLETSEENIWIVFTTTSLSVRKLTTCKFFLAQRLARPRGSTAYASTLQGFHVIWNDNMKKMLCKGYV